MTFQTKFVAAGNAHKAVVVPVPPSSDTLPTFCQCRRVRRTPFVVFFLTLSCAFSNGRAQSQASVPTFQSNTELISVPVVVRDRHGDRVHGLTRNAFHIFEDGREVNIRNFASVATQPATLGRKPAKPQTGFPQMMGDVPVILFFDQLNTPANEQSEVRRRFALWYRSQQTLAAPTCVILYTGSALEILQQPTVDAAKVRAAIENIPTTVNSHGAGASGELPLPDGAQENTPIEDGRFIPGRRLARLDYYWHRAMSAGDTESALIYAAEPQPRFGHCPCRRRR